MFYLGFFVGWCIGVLSALLFLYLIRREMENVADGERVCGKYQKTVHDCFYVEVKTGKYHAYSDLIKEYGRAGLGSLLADGIFVNEGHWEKMKEKRK